VPDGRRRRGRKLDHQAVLARMRGGWTDQEIAAELGIRPKDVRRVRDGLEAPVVVIDD
jgi:uncharacterized protein (DUF433 family)